MGEGFAWQENDGKLGFTHHQVSSFCYICQVRAADVDGNGDIDIVTASYLTSNVTASSIRMVSWFENTYPTAAPSPDPTPEPTPMPTPRASPAPTPAPTPHAAATQTHLDGVWFGDNDVSV